VTQPDDPAKEENPMKITFRKYAPALGALVAALLLVPTSRAQCGGIHIPNLPHTGLRPQMAAPSSQLARLGHPGNDGPGNDNDPAIVGLWHVKFVSQGSTGIPDGTEVDAGYSEWHSDGTEIMNSGSHAPNTSSFCLGTWQAVGHHIYKLNHFAIAWDPTQGAINSSGQPEGALVGPVQIQEAVTLSWDGSHFSGTFAIDPYDESGNNLAHVVGTITGTRITVDTPESSVF
jgi:hypothetical protein